MCYELFSSLRLLACVPITQAYSACLSIQTMPLSHLMCLPDVSFPGTKNKHGWPMAFAWMQAGARETDTRDLYSQVFLKCKFLNCFSCNERCLGLWTKELLYIRGITELCSVKRHRWGFLILFKWSIQPVGWDGHRGLQARAASCIPQADPSSWAPGCWSRWAVLCFSAVVCLWWGLFSLHLIIHQCMCMNTHPCLIFFCNLAVAWPCSADKIFSLCSWYWKKLSPFPEN